MSSINIALNGENLYTKDKLKTTIHAIVRLRSVGDSPIHFVFPQPVNIICDDFDYMSEDDNDFIRLIHATPNMYVKIKDGANRCFQVLEIGTKD
jgi:hypothetical protein